MLSPESRHHLHAHRQARAAPFYFARHLLSLFTRSTSPHFLLGADARLPICWTSWSRFGRLPFPLQRLQTYNGTEFLAYKVRDYLLDQRIKQRPIPPGLPI